MKYLNATSGPASRRISAACVLTAVRIAVETWNLIIPVLLVEYVGRMNNPIHLHHNIEDYQRCRSHKGHELRCGRGYK